MTDKEVEDIIRSNMNLQMNLAGIRQDFKEKLQRTWVALTIEEMSEIYNQADWDTVNGWEYERAIEAKLKEKNT